MVVISLISRGSPAQMTGGHLYHQRMAELAPAHGAVVERITARGLRDPVQRGAWRRARRQPHGVVGGPLVAAAQPPPAADRRHRPPAPWWRRPWSGSAPPSNDRSIWPSTGAAISWWSQATASPASWWTAGTSPPSGSAWWSRGATSRPPWRHPATSSISVEGAVSRCSNVANWWPNKGVLELLDAVATLPSRPRHPAPGRAGGRRPRLRPARARPPTRPGPGRAGGGARRRWHRPRSAGSTPAPTCSCRPAPARHTAWSTARRWRPGSRSSVGGAGACPS